MSESQLKPIGCNIAGCGKKWPRDPVLEVACPKCGAPEGVLCGAKRPSGHKMSAAMSRKNGWGCDERDILADKEGKYGECPLGGCGTALKDRGLAA